MMVNVELTPVDCACCGGTHALSETYLQDRRENGGSWNCPYCRKPLSFGRSQVDILKGEIQCARRRAEDSARLASRSEYRRRAAAGRLTKIQNKIARGECPCCGKRFQNLLEHLQRRHAAWVDEHGGLKLLEHKGDAA